ncbi:class I SAM-dependent methyltransferase [Leptolyngbya sp. FACHB-17]|uniref:class I SAM-dependent methyltransferase n=1 Tax=unclassified Leptolyngbya TaxID=2650499 RepID=UPI00168080BC|nr:class I SAM-dependent methyltransferase [Leptolyngbya sp. FACHB-17]MBD2079617.1 class I SAM-dependent methyltransferase [Leptolyngbya sp. FACHB-17]
MTETPPLHTLDPLNRFSDRATDYQKYRPSYPTSAIDKILSNLGDPTQLIAADIGAGTGISARLLSDRGLFVWGIEPNTAMSDQTEPYPRVEFRQATAENTGLPDQSVNLVTCFQSFHWFEPERTFQEFRRILKPSGRLALVWNTRDRSDPFTQEYGELLRQASNKHPAIDRMETLPENSDFSAFEEHRFTLEHALDLPALIGNAKSRSYVPSSGELLERLLQNLEALYHRNADAQGLVYVKYQTKVFIAGA